MCFGFSLHDGISLSVSIARFKLIAPEAIKCRHRGNSILALGRGAAWICMACWTCALLVFHMLLDSAIYIPSHA